MKRWIAIAGPAAALVAIGLAVVPRTPGSPPQRWRGTPGHETPESSLEVEPAADPALAAAAFARVRRRVSGQDPGPDATGDVAGPVLWLCAYRPPRDPRCAEGHGATLALALDAAAAGVGPHDGALKLDWLLAAEPARWPDDDRPHEAGAFGLRVGGAVILPSEVLERALFRAEKEDGTPSWDPAALRSLLSRRGADVTETFDFERLKTASWVQVDAGASPVRTYRLHRYDPPDVTDPGALRTAIVQAADHLAREVDAQGRIRYRWSVGQGRELAGYNLLRHAGTTYSLLQAWERVREPHWADAAERALGYLVGKSRTDERQGPFGGGRVRYLPEGSHVKLGGAALATVALATWEQATGDLRWRNERVEFARFLVSQQRETGEFVYFAPKEPGGTPKDDVSAYYPGEAVLGLMLAHALDRDPLWLDTARRGADWLLDVRDRGKGPSRLENDHWLMIALSLLYAETREERYLAHARRLAAAVAWQAGVHDGHEAFHRDYAGGYYEPPRATPASTRAEGLVAVLDACAAAALACDAERALLGRTLAHALQSQYTADLLYWMPSPERVRGGVAGGIVDPDLRNDFAQHALSAALGAERTISTSQTAP